MPIFDQGYQHWEGTLSSHTWRWWTITRQGVRAQLRSRWVRMLVIMAWIPALLLVLVVSLWGLLEQQAEMIRPLLGFLRLPQALVEGGSSFRVPVWTLAYHYFFYIEVNFAMLLVVLVGPGLISQDLRFNAIPLYFSRPLRRIDYFLGKLGVIAVFLCAVMVGPAVIAWMLGVIFSLDISVIKDTFGIMLAAVVSGVVVVLSAGMLMLALSSLSRNSRYVGAFFIGIWFISSSVAGILSAFHVESIRRETFVAALQDRPKEERLPPGKRPTREQIENINKARDVSLQFYADALRNDWRPVLSYTANLMRLESSLLDTSGALGPLFAVFTRGGNADAAVAVIAGPQYPWYWSAGVLAGIFGLSVWILRTRVKSLDRLK
jgi:ABC-2 type transport system permease protein